MVSDSHRDRIIHENSSSKLMIILSFSFVISLFAKCYLFLTCCFWMLILIKRSCIFETNPCMFTLQNLIGSQTITSSPSKSFWKLNVCVKLTEHRTEDHQKENGWAKIKKFEPYILLFKTREPDHVTTRKRLNSS